MNNRNSLIALMLVLVGGLLVYAGVRNKNPMDILKLALTGGDITTAKPLSASSGSGSIGGDAGKALGNLAPKVAPQSSPPSKTLSV
jgi:hypothetical protein